jgi:hypothetical protein
MALPLFNSISNLCVSLSRSHEASFESVAIGYWNIGSIIENNHTYHLRALVPPTPRLSNARTVYPAFVRSSTWYAQDSLSSASPLIRTTHFTLRPKGFGGLWVM